MIATLFAVKDTMQKFDKKQVGDVDVYTKPQPENPLIRRATGAKTIVPVGSDQERDIDEAGYDPNQMARITQMLKQARQG